MPELGPPPAGYTWTLEMVSEEPMFGFEGKSWEIKVYKNGSLYETRGTFVQTREPPLDEWYVKRLEEAIFEELSV